MRERITYIQKRGHSLEPSSLKFSSTEISGPDVQAVREERLTFALDELSSELRTLLKGSHELHIRWVSPVAYNTVSPLLARLPPGFHLFFTPGTGKEATTSDSLCLKLGEIFGSVACTTPTVGYLSRSRSNGLRIERL